MNYVLEWGRDTGEEPRCREIRLISVFAGNLPRIICIRRRLDTSLNRA